jgi:hypothetical protein
MTTIAQDAPQRNSHKGKPDDAEPIIIAEWPVKRGECPRSGDSPLPHNPTKNQPRDPHLFAGIKSRELVS